MERCPFCSIRDGQTFLLNNHCFFIQPKDEEVLVGSGLIMPKNHRETVFELTPEEWQSSFELLQIVKEYIDKTYKPDGYNVGWNVGRVGGQEIFHAHMHISNARRYT